MGALENIRVIDFGHYVAGPLAGMLLADQGADVIKVDPPGGPRLDHPANATWNRGKRSITLDFGDDDDLGTAASLIAGADVVIENFRPGVMARYGLDEETVRPTNPRLVYASMPGYGPEDPRAAIAAWEGVVLAGVDVFRPIVEYRDMLRQLHRRPADRGGDPVFTAEPIASAYAALLAAVGITAALNVRQESGSGQNVVVPLFDALVQSVGIFGMGRLPFKPAALPLANPWDHQYQCSDGRWIHLVCSQPHHAQLMAEVLERPDLVDAGYTNRVFGEQSMYYELADLLESLFIERPSAEWEKILIDAGLPGVICQSSAEWLDHPQAEEGGLLIELEDPALGPTRQPGPLVQLSGTGTEVRGPGPTPDQHREEILGELADPDEESQDWAGMISVTQGPLAGVKVLDLSNVLAGPTCGRTLAEFGADVIKIDDPKRRVQYYGDINRGKRSILLDLATDDGGQIFADLAATADVVIQNFRPGVVERLGVDYETVRTINPGIVYLSMNAYGRTGPMTELPGYDQTVEALTGMQIRYGGTEHPAVWPYGGVNDYAAGYSAAFGVMLALHDRKRTGKGQEVHASLAATAGYLQSMHLLGHEGQDWSEPVGPDVLGYRAHQGLYECKDGWIYVGGPETSQFETLFGEIQALEDQLVTWCEERTAEAAVAELVEVGIGADRLRWINEVMSDPAVVRRGLSVVSQGPGGGLVRTTGPAKWLSHSWIDAGRPAPEPGTDAQSVLDTVGRLDQYRELIERGVIRVPAGLD